MREVCGVWSAIKHLEIHDGPGVRTTLFLKGCPLACRWCHNPEGISKKAEIAYYAHKCENCGACASVCPHGAHTMIGHRHAFDRSKCVACGACAEICGARALTLFGKKATAEALLPELLLDQPFYKATGGGVTVSGGEPLCQADFVAELADCLRAHDVGLAIDTSLAVPEAALAKVIGKAEIFLCDVKAMDPALHKKLTGMSNAGILANFRYLADRRVPVEIRVPFVPGVNDGEMPAIAAFVATLGNVKAVKALAYHDMARTKYEALGRKYRLPDIVPPTAGQLAEIQSLFDCAIRR